MRTYILAACVAALTLATCNLPTTNALPSSTGVTPPTFRDDTDKIHENQDMLHKQDNKHHHNRRSPFAEIHARKVHKDNELAEEEEPIAVIRRIIKNADYGGGAAPMAASTPDTASAAVVSATPTVQQTTSTSTPAA